MSVSNNYFKKIVKNLIKPLEDCDEWERRLEAMSLFEDESANNPWVEFDRNDMRSIIHSLLKQITDNRSVVSRKACELITKVAQNQPVLFIPYVQLTLMTLLRQIYITVKIVANAAHNSIIDIIKIEKLPIIKIWTEIQKGFKENHNSVLRRRCSFYFLILVKFRQESINLISETFARIIVQLLRDSSPITRTRARAIYANIKDLYPSIAATIFKEVDDKVKSLLSENSLLSEYDSIAFRPTPTLSGLNSQHTSSRASSRSQSPIIASQSSTPRTQSSTNNSGLSSSLDLGKITEQIANERRTAAESKAKDSVKNSLNKNSSTLRVQRSLSSYSHSTIASLKKKSGSLSTSTTTTDGAGTISSSSNRMKFFSDSKPPKSLQRVLSTKISGNQVKSPTKSYAPKSVETCSSLSEVKVCKEVNNSSSNPIDSSREVTHVDFQSVLLEKNDSNVDDTDSEEFIRNLNVLIIRTSELLDRSSSECKK